MSNSSIDLEQRVYVDLLGIPKEKCPPNYFVLLDISPSEVDAAIIEEAASHRANLLRSGVPSELALTVRLIQKRIARARVCLLDSSARSAYLASLEKTNEDDRLLVLAPIDEPKGRSKRPETRRSINGAIKSKTPSRDTTVSLGEDLPPLLDASLFGDTASPGITLRPTSLKIAKKADSQLPVYLSIAGVVCAVLTVVGAIALFSDSSEEAGIVADGRPTVEGTAVAAQSTHSAAGEAEGDNSVTDLPQANVQSASPGNTDGADAFAIAINVPDESADEPSVEIGGGAGESVEAESALAIADPSHDEAPGEIQPPTELPSLESLATAVNLPAIRSNTSEAGEEQGGASIVELGPMNQATLETLQITIDQPKATVAANTTFYVNRGVPVGPIWEIHLKSAGPAVADTADKASSLDDAARGFDEVVAAIEASEGKLRLKWASPEHVTFAEHLRNCVLCMRSGALSHRVQLRPTQETPRFSTDLNQRNQLFEMDDQSLPEGIQFQVKNVDLAGINHELEPVNGTIGPNETLRIKLLDGQGQVELQFKFSVTSSKASVRFTPRHKLGSRWYYFTGEDVNSSINDLRAALEDAKATHSAASSAMSSLPGELASARASYNSRDHANCMARINALQGRIRKAQGALRRTSNSIPDFQAKIPFLEELAQIGKRLHQRGKLEFRVFVALNDGELDLMRTGTQDPPQMQPPTPREYE